MNICTLMGRLTSNIELKNTNNGTSVASFTLAVDRKYTPKGQERQTDFINCVAWRHTAEFLSKWFGKGDMVAVKGEIQTRNYEDKNGNKRTATEVNVDEAWFCGKKNESEPAAAPAKQSYAQIVQGFTTAEPTDFEEITGDDELPF